MNMRSIVGHKDVFLSYAHISINFARKIKVISDNILISCHSVYNSSSQSLLNEANYSVWIDEAGIRAGQKWRNEIADGIQVFVILHYLINT